MRSELKPEYFIREDAGEDEVFYAMPRLVKHIDEPACVALTDYYARNLPADCAILDLMSSYASHLPVEPQYYQVVGLGLNKVELEENPQLTKCVIHNLNINPSIPFPDRSFDACLLAVSVQYLTQPVQVLSDVARVLKPGALLAISFSNRMFPSKAVAIWRRLGDADHSRLLELYLQTAGGWTEIEFEDLSPAPGQSDPLYVVSALRDGVG